MRSARMLELQIAALAGANPEYVVFGEDAA